VKRKSALRISFCIVAGVTLLLAGCSTRKEADAEAVAAVNEIWNQYSSSFNSGDIDRWLSLWTDDGIQMPPDSPPIVGKEQIRTRNKAVLDRFTFDLNITNEEVRVAGEWAFSRGIFKATLRPKGGGKITLVDGKYMTILQRQADGSWKVYRDIFNSNVPPDEE
jgi:uncharacterized protein (TIGR02246 family)